MFNLASFAFPLAARTAFSRMGVSCLHGPHHGAQKSTSTGWRRDSSITSLMKVGVVVSLTTPSIAAASPAIIDIDLSSLLAPDPDEMGERQPDCNRNFHDGD